VNASGRHHLLRARVVAYAADIVLLFVVLAPLGWVLQRFVFGVPTTNWQIWTTLLWNFSLPTWTYFTLCDASAGGATIGKRWLRLGVVRDSGERVGPLRALARTAIKLLPWELVHVAAFAVASDDSVSNTPQTIGLVAANALALVFVASVVVTRGRRSVHDWIASTHVRAAL
jgi:uncharacterized RDD family membrane protein YckC